MRGLVENLTYEKSVGRITLQLVYPHQNSNVAMLLKLPQQTKQNRTKLVLNSDSKYVLMRPMFDQQHKTNKQIIKFSL